MTSKIQIERRTYPRYRIKTHTQILMSECYLAVNAIEMSVEGIRVEAYSEITPGTDVTVVFDAIKKLSFQGRTIWVVASQRGDYLSYLIGIKINAIMLSGVKVTGFNQKDELIYDILRELKNSA